MSRKKAPVRPPKERYDDDDLLTQTEAAAFFQISRSTFQLRCKEMDIWPANYNPALKRQPNPLYRFEEIKGIGNVKPGRVAA